MIYGPDYNDEDSEEEDESVAAANLIRDRASSGSSSTASSMHGLVDEPSPLIIDNVQMGSDPNEVSGTWTHDDEVRHGVAARALTVDDNRTQGSTRTVDMPVSQSRRGANLPQARGFSQRDSYVQETPRRVTFAVEHALRHSNAEERTRGCNQEAQWDQDR